jgi:hypothetical protein
MVAASPAYGTQQESVSQEQRPSRQAVEELVQAPQLQIPVALPQFPVLAVTVPKLQQGSYLFIQRTPGHVKYSDSDTFHNAAKAVRELLRSHQVSIFDDPVRGTIETAETFSMESVLALARQAGATYLLYAKIDRPITKWLKISLQCYDMEGRMVWQEEAAHGGGLNSSESLKKITNELDKRLQTKLGGPGLLPVLTGTQAKPAERPGDSL